MSELYFTTTPCTGKRKIKQGQSDGTEFKERRLGALFYINLKISKSSFLRSRPYFHFDLYAGSGYNEEVGCIGSPLAFLKAVEDSDRTNFYAHFVEKDPLSCDKLARRLAASKYPDRCFLHPGDNADFIEAIPHLISCRNQRPSNAVGSILIDPNGHNIPWDQLAEISRLCPKLDMFFNYNTTIAKRLAGLVVNIYRGKLVRLETIPEHINKTHVQLATPTGTRNQFVLMACRNFRVGDYAKLGIYHWHSEEGKSIRYRYGLSKKEKNTNQGALL